MKQNNQNFPYPILVNNSIDYNENAKFSIQINSMPHEVLGSIQMNFQYYLNCEGLEELIKTNKAIVILQLICKETLLRKNYIFNDKELLIELNKKDIMGNVVINSFIVATVDINNFHLPEHNDMFKNCVLNINKGDKLAIGEVISFKINKFDSLRPVASIVSIKENTNSKNAIDLDFNSDKIYIYLSKETYEKYQSLREYPELRLYLSINIVLPAIVEALNEIKSNNENFLERRWVSTIKKVLKNLNIDIYNTELSCYAIANIIFKNGLLTELTTLEKVKGD